MTTSGKDASDDGRCPNCNVEPLDDSNYCPRCGSELRHAPSYCRVCGSEFERGDEYCSSCGTARRPEVGDDETTPATDESVRHDRSVVEDDADAAPRRSPERVGQYEGLDRADAEPTEEQDDTDRSRAAVDDEDYRAFRRRIQTHLQDGWEVEDDYGERVVLIDRDFGTMPAHLLLLFTTGGFGNMLYAWYRHSVGTERRYLTVDDVREREPTDLERRDETGSVRGFWSAVTIVIGLGFLATMRPVGIGIGLTLLAVGTVSFPPISRRFNKRHSVTTVGRTRSVDSEVIQPETDVAGRCIVCDETTESGLARRRRDETVVAGIPVRTHDVSYNLYCAECARGEAFDDEPPVPPSAPSVTDELDDQIEHELDAQPEHSLQASDATVAADPLDPEPWTPDFDDLDRSGDDLDEAEREAGSADGRDADSERVTDDAESDEREADAIETSTPVDDPGSTDESDPDEAERTAETQATEHLERE